MDGGLSYLVTPVAVVVVVMVVVVVVIVMVDLRASAMNVENLATLLVNVVCVLVLGVWAAEGVAAGAAAAARETAGVRAMVEEATALAIALQDAEVFRQPVGAAIASRQRTTVAVMILLMLKEMMVPGIAAAGVRPEDCFRLMFLRELNLWSAC